MAQFFYTPLSSDFFNVCAETLLARYNPQNDPLALTHVTVWVPSSRMADSLAESLLKQAGGGVLLPDIRPMGTETDDVLLFEESVQEGTMSGFERLMFLTDYCMKHMPHAQWSKALNLAKHLDTLWKKMLLSGVEMNALKEAIPEEWAERWEDISLYLSGLTEAYPNHLKHLHKKDETLHKIDVLKAYTAQYQKNALTQDVWTVGFSDTIEPARDMLKALSLCERSHFIMPLDGAAFPKVFSQERLDPTHPLYGLQGFMGEWELTLQQLEELKKVHCSYVPLFDDVPSVQDVNVPFILCEAGHLEGEAETIAWIMAERAMLPQKTCALVTSDLSLAFRVQTILEHYGLFVDRTNSSPFVSTPLGAQALQILECMLSGYKPEKLAGILLNPVTNRGMHTHVAGSLDEKNLRGMLRGQTSLTFWNSLIERGEISEEAASQQFSYLLSAFSAFNSQASRPLSGWLKAHLELLVALGEAPVGRAFLTREEEALKAWQVMIEQTGHLTSSLSFKDYAERFAVLFETVSIPNRTEGAHPRLKILGPLESRLQRYDCVILGGLNEGTTPGQISPDVWLSYAQRKELNLPPVESSIGLSAHDFLSQLYADEVVLTRRTQSEDGITLPSRFLMRLKSAVGESAYQALLAKGNVYVKASEKRRISGKGHVLTKAACMTALSDASPKFWSPSYIKDMMGCPYKAYLRKGASLDALEPYGKSPDAALRGTLIHEVLSTFCEAHPVLNRDEEELDQQRLIDLAADLLEKNVPAAVQAVWQTRFEKLAPDILRFWHERQDAGWHQSALEEKVSSDKTAVPLFAVLDRVDVSPSGDLSILDYKTGSLPIKKDIYTGAQPQLVLEALAWMNAHAHTSVKQLLYLRLPAGSKDGAKDMVIAHGAEKIEPLIEQAEEGLSMLNDLYRGADKAWPAVAGGVSAVKLSGACENCDYSGVCRVREWVSTGGHDS